MKRASTRSSIAILHIVLGLFLAACSDDGASDAGDDEAGDGSLAIIGDYVDNFGFSHSITVDDWVIDEDSIHAIAEFDNKSMYVIAQNDEGNSFNPGLWSRFDWAWDGDQLHFCQSVYDGPSIDDARDGGADASDLTTGCGGFAWSTLTPQ